MSYKIAIATSDDLQVDLHFGGTDVFTIVDVREDGSFMVLEKRKSASGNEAGEGMADGNHKAGCGSNCGHTGGGCGNGHSDEGIEAKVNLISDCRCLLCRKIGPGAERQLERRAITVFQIELTIEVSLPKIIDYYSKIDHHISLRNI